MDVLTYEEIRGVERKEKDSKGVSSLNDDFITRYNDYLSDKRKILDKDDDNLIAKRVKAQSESELKNAKDCFQRIFVLRAKKLIEQAFIDLKMGTGIDTKNLLDFEKDFYSKIKDMLLNHMQLTIKRKVKKEENVKLVNKDNVMARFVKDLPEFAWGNSVLGPFSKEDVVNLPKSIIEVLLKKNVVEVI